MSVKKQMGCPFCEQIIPANTEHVCANPTKSFLTAHACHEDTQPLEQAYATNSDWSPREKRKH